MIREIDEPNRDGRQASQASAGPAASSAPWLLRAAMLVQFAATGAVLPFVTLLLRDRGLTYDRISAVLLAASATMLFFPFLWGMLADRYLPLDRLFILVNLLGAVALGGMAVQESFTGLLVTFTAYAACLNPTFALTNALAFHHLPDPRRQFGRLRAWGSIGWMVPFLPISLWTASNGRAGLDLILYLGMAGCVAMAVLAAWLPHTPPGARPDAKPGASGPLYLPAVKRLLRNPDYLVLLAAMFLVSGSFNIAMYYAPPFLEGLGVARPWIGPVQALGILCEIVLFPLQPVLLRRWNYAAMLISGCAMLVLRQLLFVFVDDPWVLSASYVLTGAVILCFHMGVSVLVNVLTAVEVRATAQTLLSFFGLGLGPMFANWAVGRLAGRYHDDLRPAFLFAAATAAAAMFLVGLRGRHLNAAGHQAN